MGEITTRKLSSNSLEAIKQHIEKKTEILKKNVDLENIEEIGTLLDAYKNKINTFGKIIESEKNKIAKESTISVIKDGDAEEILDEEIVEKSKDTSKNIDNNTTSNHHIDKNKVLNNVNVFKGCSIGNTTNTSTSLDNKNNSNNSKELI